MHLLVISWYKCWSILNMFCGMLKHYLLLMHITEDLYYEIFLNKNNNYELTLVISFVPKDLICKSILDVSIHLKKNSFWKNVILAVVSFKLAPNWGFTLYCVNGTCGICSDLHTCIFRAVSVTFHHLQALFTPDVNIHLGWSQLVRQDRLLFTHMLRKCVFCDHLWVLSSGRSLI